MNDTKKMYDVVIIGAGLAGLTTAYRLHGKGYSVIVLEAKSRVGGRLFSQEIPGGVVDAGGSWVGPQQTAILGLVKKLGMSTWTQYTRGRHLLLIDVTIKIFTGETPPLPLLALLDIRFAMWKLDRIAKQLRGDHPWSHQKAKQLDMVTLGNWLSKNIHTKGAYFFFHLATAASFGSTPDELSLFGFLTHVAAAGDLQTLIGIQHAALEQHITGGAQGVCTALATHLGNSIHFNTVVTAIKQTNGSIECISNNEIFHAKKAVITI